MGFAFDLSNVVGFAFDLSNVVIKRLWCISPVASHLPRKVYTIPNDAMVERKSSVS